MKIPYHYFASSATSWTKHASLETCLRVQRQGDEINKAKNCNIYRIYGNVSRHYEVKDYLPVVGRRNKEFVAIVIY